MWCFTFRDDGDRPGNARGRIGWPKRSDRYSGSPRTRDAGRLHICQEQEQVGRTQYVVRANHFSRLSLSKPSLTPFAGSSTSFWTMSEHSEVVRPLIRLVRLKMKNGNGAGGC